MITRDPQTPGLFVAEATRVPSNRCRLTQIVAALLTMRASSVGVGAPKRRYPRMRRGATCFRVLSPLLAVLSVTNAAEVPVAARIVWVLAVITFLIGLQYLREA